MTASREMRAAGLRLLDLLTASEAALVLGCPAGTVHRLAAEGKLEREWFGPLARFDPESVAACRQRMAAEAAKAS